MKNKQTIAEAWKLYSEKKYKDAVRLLNAIDSWPLDERLEAYDIKGQSNYACGSYSSAVKCFEYIIENQQNQDKKAVAFYYKGNALYALDKHIEAVESYKMIPEEQELSICANLYIGLSYEAIGIHQEAELYFRKVQQLYSSSGYYDKDTILDISQRELVKSLINQDRFDELIKEVGSKSDGIDSQDSMGNTLLMHAVTHQKPLLIEKLLAQHADPFKSDEFGNTAFSIAIRTGQENCVKMFLKTKIKDIEKSPELSQYLPALVYAPQKEKDIDYYIASHICLKESTLRDLLSMDEQSAKICFADASSRCEVLGVDASSLLGMYELVA